MKNSTFCIALLIIWCQWINATIANSQKDTSLLLNVKEFSIEAGLRQSMVRAIHQDSQGLLWVVSGDGLHFFDGQHFKAFRVPSIHGTDDQDNMMRGICAAGKNKLLIASTSSILEFDIASANFKILMRQNGLYPEIVLPNFNGAPLIWVYNKGFFVFRDDKINKVEINGLEDDFFKWFYPIQAVWVGNKQKAFITSDKGVVELQSNPNNPFIINAIWHKNLAGCSGIALGGQNRVWIASNASIYELSQGKLLHKVCDLPTKAPVFLYTDSQGGIWIAAKTTKQLFHLKKQQLSKVQLFVQQGRFVENLSPTVLSIVADNTGTQWFGTDGNGIIRYNPNEIRLTNANIGFVRSLACRGQEVFAGTYLNGLWQLNADLTTKHKIVNHLLPSEAYCLDMTVDSHSRLWVATTDRVLVFDKNLSIVYYLNIQSDRASFYNLGHDSLLFSNGTAIFFDAGNRITPLKTKLFGSFNAAIELDRWQVFASSFGLYKLDNKNLTDPKVLLDQNTKLYPLRVNDLAKLQNALWAATNTGIKVFDFNGKELVTDVRLNELSEEKIYNLCPDTMNRLWFSANSGIGCLLPNNGRIIRLGMHNNLQSLEFNQNAAAQSSNGWIYFGGINGLNGIQPENIVFERHNPGVRLISLEVADSLITKGIPANKLHLELDWHNAHVSGQIASLVNENQELTTYSFYMEGYQNDWGPRSYNRAFTYRDLPPGNYTLKVVSFDAYQNKSSISELLHIYIPQPYYKRTWFVLLSISILLVMVALVVKRVQYMRFKQKLNDLQQLNAIDKERLRISQDMHDEIGASLTRISILSELVKNKRSSQEEALKIVSQISAIAGKVVDDMGEIIWAMNPKNDSAEGFASYLRQYAANYLEQTGIEAIFEIQEDFAEIKLRSELRRNLFLVVKEALHNIVKHSKANQVLISLKLQNHVLNLCIKDNGIGFEPNANTIWGNGLKNMPMRIRNTGGSIQINSSLGQGVEILIHISNLK